MSLSFLTLSYTGGGGGTKNKNKVPALISKIRIFETNTATATKFDDLNIKFIGEDNGVLIIPTPIKPLPWQPLFLNPLLRI